MKYTYQAFYRNRQVEVSGEDLTLVRAREQAALQLKAHAAYDVIVILAAKDDQPVVHIPDF